jgi:hypothetical protein
MRVSSVFVLGLLAACSDGASGPAAPGAGGTSAQAGSGTSAAGAGSSGESATTPAAGSAGQASSGSNSGGSAGATAMGGAGGGEQGGGGAAGAGGQANPEGVPADYQLFIDESFAQPESLQKLRFADPQDWVHQAADGGYIENTAWSYAPPHASLHALAIFPELKFGAFLMELEIMQTNPSGGHRDFCPAWGMESPARYYYSHIAQAHDGVAHNIHIVLEADRTAITETFTPGFDWGASIWHKFRVTRSAAGAMAVYADGEAMPILTANDARLGAGYIGFGSFDDKGRVRNVKVWAPSAEQAPATFFSTK